MKLPQSSALPVATLARCFNKTTATYKYYWLLAILQAAESGTARVSKKALFARMIANAWFTVNYFKLSFGQQDLIQKAVQRLSDIEAIPMDAHREHIFQQLLDSHQPETNTILRHFNKNVPHWFLSPWFPSLVNETDTQRRQRMYVASRDPASTCL